MGNATEQGITSCPWLPSKCGMSMAKGLRGASVESPGAQQHLETGRASKAAAETSREMDLNGP